MNVSIDETPAIRARHLWHRYGAFEVLRDVTFDVRRGEIFGFIGPNGAGKTTTIRIMATLLEPMAGRVEIDGIDVAPGMSVLVRRNKTAENGVYAVTPASGGNVTWTKAGALAKGDVVRRILEGPQGADYPAARVRPANGSVTWIITRDAASRLSD